MAHYLIKFIFYTSGVIGLLLIAFIVAKNSLNINPSFRKKNGKLEIEESLPISPRKQDKKPKAQVKKRVALKYYL